jgi:transposase
VPPIDDIEELEKQLDPAARVLVSMMRAAFEKQLENLKTQIEELRSENEKLRSENAELRRMLFGRKSEKIPPIESEVRRAIEADEYFGDEDEEPRDEGSEEDEAERDERRATARRKQGRKKSEKSRKRRRLAKKNLPVIHEQVTVTPDQLPEGYGLEGFRKLGDGEVVHRLEHVREHLVMVEYTLERLASSDGEHIVSASAPEGVIDGGQYGPGVYAHIAVAKCDDSLPLYRIERAFARDGYSIARSTLGNLFHRAAELLQPISKRLLELACADPYLSADETTLPVNQKGGCRKDWIWTFISPLVIAYHFSKSRAGQVPTDLLGQSQGYLQVDGYKGYNAACDEEKRTRVGCWSHCRRMFFKALSSTPEARDVLDLIVNLYRVEYEAAEKEILGTDAHLALRLRRSKKVIGRIKRLLAREKPKHLPEGPMGKAITYAQNQWESLTVFLTDPKLRLDNNLSENALRIIALGRKNFLFVGTEVAGSNLAGLQTVIATCKLHGVNPYEYIRDVIIRVQSHPASRLDELLPFNWKPAAE